MKTYEFAHKGLNWVGKVDETKPLGKKALEFSDETIIGYFVGIIDDLSLTPSNLGLANEGATEVWLEIAK